MNVFEIGERLRATANETREAQRPMEAETPAVDAENPPKTAQAASEDEKRQVGQEKAPEAACADILAKEVVRLRAVICQAGVLAADVGDQMVYAAGRIGRNDFLPGGAETPVTVMHALVARQRELHNHLAAAIENEGGK
jgi:hypothetical protein